MRHALGVYVEYINLQIESENKMDGIKYLLKFGKYPHIKEFAKGSLYCSPARTFWKIEKDLNRKGQGDILEGGMRLFIQQMTLTENGTNKALYKNGKTRIPVYFSVEDIPVFCLFIVGEGDCSVNEFGDPTINLSEDIKKTIKDHFPDADSVGVIKDPDSFIHDVEDTVGHEVKYGKVHYFHIDKGFPANDGINTANDLEYIKYLTQDTPPINGRYCLASAYSYRALFCKDVFFKDEHEYRIILPSETITHGTHYPIHIRQTINIMSINEFIN